MICLPMCIFEKLIYVFLHSVMYYQYLKLHIVRAFFLLFYGEDAFLTENVQRSNQ